MEKKALRHSKQRDSVFHLLQSTKSHPTAEWLYENLKKEKSGIGLATIYRNLKLLESEGKIISFNVDSKEHYDACLDIHYHLVCNECKRVIDIMPKEKINVNEVIDTDSVSVDNYSLLFYGTCSHCKKE